MFKTVTVIWIISVLCVALLLPGCGDNGTAGPGARTISGTLGTAGAGASLGYRDGTAKSITADADGNYSLTVSAGWSGTVAPSLTGYTFTPASRSYTNLQASLSAQDYIAVPVTFAVSGNAGIAGAVLSYTDGGARTVTSDGTGAYSFTVSYNWSGTVTPSAAGRVFTPANRSFANVTADQPGQDLAADLAREDYLDDGFEGGGWTATRITTGRGSTLMTSR